MAALKPGDLVFKAIADPTRRKILALLKRKSMSVGGIATKFTTSRPAISKHLRVLEKAGLVQTEKHGTSNLCQLNTKPLRTVTEWLQAYGAL